MSLDRPFMTEKDRLEIEQPRNTIETSIWDNPMLQRLGENEKNQNHMMASENQKNLHRFNKLKLQLNQIDKTEIQDQDRGEFENRNRNTI